MYRIILLSIFCIWGGSESSTAQVSPIKDRVAPQSIHNETYVSSPPTNLKKRIIQYSPAHNIDKDGFLIRQVNISDNGQNILQDAANEPSIAINPLNPDEMMIGWRQFDDIRSDFRQAGYAYTIDGGQSWTFPGVIEPGIFRSDPVLGTDAQGNFYYSSLTAFFGEDSLRIYQNIFKSDSLGSWDEGVYAFGGDKQWIAIDQNPDEEANIYSYWSSFSDCENEGNFTRSIDAGASFDSCTSFGEGFVLWGTMDIGPNRELYIAGLQFSFLGNGYMLFKSSNAWNKTEAIEWELVSEVELGLKDNPTPHLFMDPNPAGLLGQVELSVDRSGGTTNGNIYVLSSLKTESDSLDIMFARSTDKGKTWDPPIRINDDSRADDLQWFGTMSVAPNGRIDVVWLDTRASPATVISALYYSYSIDGGVNWSPNRKLSDFFDSHIGWPVQQKMGDYFDMVSDNEGAHLAWAATFNGEQDVYYSYIQPGSLVSNEENLTKALDFKVFPNPFSAKFSVESSSRELTQLSVVNYLGQEVQTEEFIESIELDASHWPRGVYFIKISNEKSLRGVKQLVKN